MSLATLAAAVEDAANTAMSIDCGSTFSSMTCDEAESFAALFAVAGRMDAAAHVIMMHAESDEEADDSHNDVHEALNADGAGFSHDEADEPYRLAMAHARELV